VSRARWAAAAALAVALAAAPAVARANNDVVHKARAGDTLELLAAEYYGERNYAVFIMVANRMDHPRPLKPGDRIRIPVGRQVTAKVGDTFESLAATHLGDPRRGEFLAEFNGLAAKDTIAAGTVLQVPLTVTYVAENQLSLGAVAAAYLGDAKNADLLRRYNFLDKDKLAKGESIVVPIRNVRVRESKLPAMDAESRERTEKRRKTQELAFSALPGARAAWRQGDFAAIKRELTRLDLDYLDTALAVEVGVLLGAAYVAFADNDSALAVFKRVLERRPGHALDGYLYSPKVRDVWKRAGGALAGPT
jgi:LysM repeat protein